MLEKYFYFFSHRLTFSSLYLRPSCGDQGSVFLVVASSSLPPLHLSSLPAKMLFAPVAATEFLFQRGRSGKNTIVLRVVSSTRFRGTKNYIRPTLTSFPTTLISKCTWVSHEIDPSCSFISAPSLNGMCRRPHGWNASRRQ